MPCITPAHQPRDQQSQSHAPTVQPPLHPHHNPTVCPAAIDDARRPDTQSTHPPSSMDHHLILRNRLQTTLVLQNSPDQTALHRSLSEQCLAQSPASPPPPPPLPSHPTTPPRSRSQSDVSPLQSLKQPVATPNPLQILIPATESLDQPITNRQHTSSSALPNALLHGQPHSQNPPSLPHSHSRSPPSSLSPRASSPRSAPPPHAHSAPPIPTRKLAFSRLRTAHDSTIRSLVHKSWDVPCNHSCSQHAPGHPTAVITRTHTAPTTNIYPPNDYIPGWRRALRPFLGHALPPRSSTDVTGVTIHAARMAEMAAQDAAEASAAAKAAAAYARRLADDASAAALSSRGLRKERPRDKDRESVSRDVFDVDAIEEASRSFCHATQMKAPHISLVTLGKSWSVDAVAVVHNAIRLDLADLLDIVSTISLDASDSGVTMAQLEALFAWFSTFEAFVVTCLKAEEEVIFPWLEQWGRIEGELSTASRINIKGGIIRGIRDTAACAAIVGLDKDLPAGMVLTNPDRNYYDGLKVGFAEMAPMVTQERDGAFCDNVLRKMTDHISKFSEALLDYFEEQERSLPGIIETLYDPEDMYAAGVERRTMRAIWKCGRKDESMVMLLRAVEGRAFARQWLGRNLKRMERVSIPLWKRRYNSGRGAVTARFKERKTRWERTASALEMHRRDEFQDVRSRVATVSPPRSLNRSSTSIYPTA